jgi:hypothetical protein
LTTHFGVHLMTDQTDALLSELVDLQRRALSNQERALANQEQALVRQRAGVRRARTMLWLSWILVAILVASLFIVPLLNMIGRWR